MIKIEEMRVYCENEQIFWFCDLANHASRERGDWLRTLVTEIGASIMSDYLANKAYKAGLLTDAQYLDLLDF